MFLAALPLGLLLMGTSPVLLAAPSQISSNPAQKLTALPKHKLQEITLSLSDPFPMPSGLQHAVQFWMALFSQYNSEQALLHDKEQLHVVWEVIDLPKQHKNHTVDEKAAQQMQQDILKNYEKRLQRLALRPLPFDATDRYILQKAKRLKITDLAAASQRLRLQRGVADHFAEGLKRSQNWLPEIKKILQQEGVPQQIAALPFVESMFNPQARSHAGASGIWQLMPKTAKALGLKYLYGSNDERRQIRKATKAAAKLLKQNYRSLGSWPLAITAYNHGSTSVRKAVKEVGSDDLSTLIANYQKASWGFASKNFYAEFLAALKLLQNQQNLLADNR